MQSGLGLGTFPNTENIEQAFFLSKRTLCNIAKVKTVALGHEKTPPTQKKTRQKDLERLLSP